MQYNCYLTCYLYIKKSLFSLFFFHPESFSVPGTKSKTYLSDRWSAVRRKVLTDCLEMSNSGQNEQMVSKHRSRWRRRSCFSAQFGDIFQYLTTLQLEFIVCSFLSLFTFTLCAIKFWLIPVFKKSKKSIYFFKFYFFYSVIIISTLTCDHFLWLYYHRPNQMVPVNVDCRPSLTPGRLTFSSLSPSSTLVPVHYCTREFLRPINPNPQPLADCVTCNLHWNCCSSSTHWTTGEQQQQAEGGRR